MKSREYWIKTLQLVPHPEGGYFREIYRSGSQLAMKTNGQTDLQKNDDGRRNELTTIYWMACKEQLFSISINMSDHVHFYHEGSPFLYILIDPTTGHETRVICGPDVDKGHHLQVCVPGGLWKCGYMLADEHNQLCDYTLISEAVAPGFDFHDFRWVSRQEIEGVIGDDALKQELLGYVHEDCDKTLKEVVDGIVKQFYNN